MDYLDEMEVYARARKIPVVLRESREYLEKLCKDTQPKNILEIGMAIGYSGACMLRQCNANLCCLEISKPNIKLAKENFEKLGLISRVEIIEGDCLKTLPTLLGRKFDLIFLDGPKGTYVDMVDMILPLLEKNGVWVSDNVLFRGMVLDGKPISEPRFERTVAKMRDFITKITTNETLNTNIYHIGDGISEVRFK